MLYKDFSIMSLGNIRLVIFKSQGKYIHKIKFYDYFKHLFPRLLILRKWSALTSPGLNILLGEFLRKWL